MGNEHGLRVPRQIVNITPLSPLATNVYVPEFNYLRSFQGVVRPFYRQQVLTSEFMEQNEPLYESVEQRAEMMETHGNFAHEYRLGAHIAYRNLQSQAGLEGGIPIRLTPQNIERYERDLYGDANYEYIRDLRSQCEDEEALDFENTLFLKNRPKLLFYLHENEPLFMEKIDSNLRNLMSFRYDAVIDGVIDTYFPFRVRQEVKKVRRIVRQNGF